MSAVMEEEIKRWTARRKSALILEIIQGKTTVAEASSQFPAPHGGGDRAFVHIKAFQPDSRRPVDGDPISYAVTRDERGRNNATEVRFAGERIEQRQQVGPSARIPL